MSKKEDHKMAKEDPGINKESGKGHEKDSHKDEKKKKGENIEEINHQWQARYDELNDKYLRLYSEFDNYRKRTQKERIEQSKFASEEMILSLLPVMDDLERALGSVQKNGEGNETVPQEAIQLIYQKFKGILTQKGLEAITSMGEPFDVDFHDAITNIPAPSEDMKGKVVDEIEKGYKLHGKVIRYSKVVVGN